jgi:hypothetical protein
MFSNLKKTFAKVALTVLALQLAFVGVGAGATSAHAITSEVTNIQTTYAKPNVTALAGSNFVNTVTLKGIVYKDATANAAYGVVGITRTDDATTQVKASDVEVSLNGVYGTADINASHLAAVKGTTANSLVLVWPTFTLTNTNGFANGIVSNFDVKIKTAGTYKFQNQIIYENVAPAKMVNATPEDMGNLITVDAPPALVSVTAILGGVTQVKPAAKALEGVLGESVGTIYATVSKDVVLASGITSGQITITGGTIPANTPYGTFIVNPLNAKELIITPNVGNDALGQLGTFTFNVGAGTIQDPAGNVNDATSFTMNVTTNVLSAIAPIVGTPQVGVVLTAGALTPALATAIYQWQSSVDGVNFENISGANLNTYKLVVGDLGQYIRVLATATTPYNGNVVSAPTTTVMASPVAPAAVTDLVVTIGANGQVTLTWVNPPAGTYSGLRVYRVGDFYVDLPAGTTTFTDLTAVGGKTYQYVVMVLNEQGNSTSTPQVTVAVPVVVAAAVSDSFTPQADASTPEVKADTAVTEPEAQNSDDNGFPVWGIVLLVILAAVGAYLIWSQKPEPVVAPVEPKKKTSTPKKK